MRNLPALIFACAVTAFSATTAVAQAPAETSKTAPAIAWPVVSAPEKIDALHLVPTTAEASTTASGEAVVPAAPPPPAEPTLTINIDLSSQSMTVAENGDTKYTWAISSARSGYRTPTGTFKPTWMSKMWYSRQYDMAPMPHAVFFSGGVAIHATYATGMLGNPASHGCVRLAPKNAATLYRLVNAHGKDLTRISVRGIPKYRNSNIASNRRNNAQRYAQAHYGFGFAQSYNSYGYSQPYYVKRPAYAQPYAQKRRNAQRLPARTKYSYVYGNGY
jgi:lipoprotein-anchoring transpeptidase ErfK/SrfK